MKHNRLFVRSCRSSQLGQLTSEYLVACLVVLVLLGVANLEWKQDEDTEGKAVYEIFLESIEDAYEDLTSFLSLPI